MWLDPNPDFDLWSSLENADPNNINACLKQWSKTLISIRSELLSSKEFIGSFSDQIQLLCRQDEDFRYAYNAYVKQYS